MCGKVRDYLGPFVNDVIPSYDVIDGALLIHPFPGGMAEEEEGSVPLQSYDDPNVAAIVVDTNYEKLVQSLDPAYFALNLIYRHLMTLQESRAILKDREKTRSEMNLAFLNLTRSSSDPTWFSALLETLGEDKTTERLKDVLEKSELVWSLERCVMYGGSLFSIVERCRVQ